MVTESNLSKLAWMLGAVVRFDQSPPSIVDDVTHASAMFFVYILAAVTRHVVAKNSNVLYYRMRQLWRPCFLFTFAVALTGGR